MPQDWDYRINFSSTGPQPSGQASTNVSGTRTAGIPSVSLPKGGGAIRGIGEKFAVNLAMGTAASTVSLPSSRGRSGFGPELSLSYNSAAGNGPFGFGWNLSLPTITRKTERGLPRYLDEDESDIFMLSGAEDLVPILGAAGNRMSLSRTVHGIEYKIHLYRPRIEGLFARIERWTAVDNQISHWRTITRDNVTTIFGLDENARIFDPDDPRHIFSYLISLTFDDKGNATRYEYVAENSARVNVAASHEANRTDATRATQRYLKYVSYGNVQPYFADWSPLGAESPLPTEWHFRIVFDYGDHGMDAPLPDPLLDQQWAIRPDPFSTFRAGFEVRTYRRCERVLLFHQFVGQAGFEEPTLVRSTDFSYSDETAPENHRNPIYTFMQSVTQIGYRRTSAGYEQRSMPPLEFFYSEIEIHSEILTLTDADSRENLPEGLNGSRFQWTDLDGQGLGGILTAQDGGWYYKRNLSPINRIRLASGVQVVRAKFGPLEKIPSLPAPAHLGDSQQLLDLTGEGRPDLVIFGGPMPGYFGRTADGDWETLKTFNSLPVINWSEPNLKFVDLTGDGRADVLITEDNVYTFYASLGIEGFGQPRQVFIPSDEERGPRVVFADGTETVSLADISGDGLSDIVRVRNGEICYWPNLGYGRFGAKITMDNAPRFDEESSFDARRIRFADVDGSGTTDVLYIGGEGVQICFNRSGNSWADPHTLAIFPGADNPGSIQVIDLLGNGTACLVWSSPLPGESYLPLRYVDLTGAEKPHLMVRTRNNLGAETRLSYAPSTRFYLQDKLAGKPWITRLPFPVHVVERVEVYDWIGHSRFVTQYAYHHGYFDGEEREFRGFGMVEQRDTAIYGDDALFQNVETMNEDASSFVPPTLTRTWFHTGAFIEAETVSQQYANEYWVEPALRGDAPDVVAEREAMLLPDTVLTGDPNPVEMREAYRALRGSVLRTEVYAEDGTTRAEHPYTVTEQNFAVSMLQPRGPNQHAVFLTHARESLTYHYERQPSDPRVTHNITLAVDDFGNIRRSITIGYGRRSGYPQPEPSLSGAFRAMLAHDQSRLHVNGIEHNFTNCVNKLTDALLFDSYRAPMQSETITAELTGISAPATLFRFEDFDGTDGVGGFWETLWSGAHDIPYEEVSRLDVDGVGGPTAFGRRIIEHTRILYRGDDMNDLLPLGVLNPLALLGESYRLALTPGLITRIFDSRVTDDILLEGGYVRPADQNDWWIPSGRVFFSDDDLHTPLEELTEARSHFFQPRRTRDPFGAINRVSYDEYDLLPIQTTDAVGNVTSFRNNYRVLQPDLSTDPNGNRTELAFDCLGLVVGGASMGKITESLGDSLVDFDPDLSEVEIQASMREPLANPNAILNTASQRIVYDLFAYFRTRDLATPAAPLVYTLSRETHASDLSVGQPARLHHAFTYSDGFGREVQHKAQTEPGPIAGIGDNVSPRWVGTGWTIYNNKGKPVRKYEPFFSPTHEFEFNERNGVSSVLFYDPVDRVIATLYPDNTFEKTIINAWRRETWDRNDTVLVDDPRADADVGEFFRQLFGTAPETFISWHQRRIGGAWGDSPEDRATNQDAARKAESHAGTPTVIHFDALGRATVSVTDNGLAGIVPQRFATRTALNSESKELAIFDPLGRRVMEFFRHETSTAGGFHYVAGSDIAGSLLYRNGMDSGEVRSLNDVWGNHLRSWDSREFIFRSRYDALRRLTHRFIAHGGFGEILSERLIYGEKHPDLERNLKGRLFRHYDGAGVASHERYDFKGNLIATLRQFARHRPAISTSPFYNTTPDWSVITDVSEEPTIGIAALEAATEPLLVVNDRFIASHRFDAMNRIIQTITPHNTSVRPSVIQPSYNEASLLDRVDVWLRQADDPGSLIADNPATPPDIPAITNISYNAKGQRDMLSLGNGVITNYTYDPETFRLSTLTTNRPDTIPAAARTVQALTYQYDPVGNITSLRDTADIHNVVYFRNQRVEPSADYTYDALYRLKIATGREHLGQTGGTLNASVQVDHDDSPRTHSGPTNRLLNPGDGNAMGNYTERYEYDAAGNFTSISHQAAGGSWTRYYSYAEPSLIDSSEMSNRLSATSLPGDRATGPYTARYEYDPHGNTTKMPHLPTMTWDEHDRLQSTTRQSAGALMPETTYYSYDASGERLRKATFWSTASGNVPKIKSERLYLGNFEIYREYDLAGVLVKERETLHVVDDKQRIAMVETLTFGVDDGPRELKRYQHSNHLGSANLELDDQADVISYEEYFPFGSTSYQAVRNQTETPKRYRYTGKERDEESEFYYHGARYYAAWLARWISTDPIGIKDGPNVYAYVRARPITKYDPEGHESADAVLPSDRPRARNQDLPSGGQRPSTQPAPPNQQSGNRPGTRESPANQSQRLQQSPQPAPRYATQANINELARIIMSETSARVDREAELVGHSVANRMLREHTTSVMAVQHPVQYANGVRTRFARDQAPNQQARAIARNILTRLDRAWTERRRIQTDLQTNHGVRATAHNNAEFETQLYRARQFGLRDSTRQILDPSGGATHFLSPAEQTRQGRARPVWADPNSNQLFPRSTLRAPFDTVPPTRFEFYRQPGVGPTR